jgi:DNA-binding GntR family transcriptional regulator
MDLPSVTTATVDYIRNKIITGQFAPGQRLEENKLAAELDVSRPPLREAFRVLERARLVLNVHRKGTFVTEMSQENLIEVYQVREMIECYAVDILASNKSKDISRLESSLKENVKSPPALFENSEQYLKEYELLVQFHLRLVESAENSWLNHVYHQIVPNLARYQFITLKKSGDFKHNFDEHSEIYESIRNGAFSKAKELLRTHIKKRLKEPI